GLFFLPMLRARHVTFRPLMPVMVASFAAMNALFVSAIALGTSANAILLQNTAPFFVYVVSVLVLGEPPDRRSLYALLVGMVGIVVGGGAVGDRLDVTLMGLGSGVTYAAIILCLRFLRSESPQWLVFQNHFGSATCLAAAVLVLNGPDLWVDWIDTGPDMWWRWVTTPILRQLAFLAFFVT